MSRSSHLDRVLTIFQEAIDAEKYYEAHQACRSAARRMVNQKKYEQVKQLLYTSSKQLLQQGQMASGTDLATYLLQVYEKDQTPVGSESMEKVVELLGLMIGAEAAPTRKAYIHRAISWTRQMGTQPKGSPQLHHLVGVFLWNEGEVQEAEKHLMLGTAASAKALGGLLASTTTPTTSPGSIILPSVLQYLAQGNIRDSRLLLNAFLDSPDLCANTLKETANLKEHPESTDPILLPLYQDPLLNFTLALLSAVRREARDLFILLKDHARQDLQSLHPTCHRALTRVAERYFGITPPAPPPNPMSLLSGLLGGGGRGGLQGLPSMD